MISITLTRIEVPKFKSMENVMLSTVTEENFSRSVRKPEKNKVAIVGYNPAGINVYLKLSQHPKDLLRFAGFIRVYDIAFHPEVTNLPPILGKISSFKEIVEEYGIERVIIALDPTDIGKIHEIIQLCKTNNVQYDLISELYDIVYGQVFRQILLDIKRPIEISYRRFFDLLFSIPLFVLFLPLWIIIAIAIKLDSPGPVIYSQERVGKYGRVFRIFKFRSMRSDAEKLSGPQLATENDPRITRVGRFLRKTRLDELPQLINVIIGDMSIIGPRPERPYFVEKYKKEIPFYMNRLRVKPGITGLAQVETGYDESIEDVREKLKYDIYYIEHRKSVWLNLKILLKTIWVVFTAQGI